MPRNYHWVNTGTTKYSDGSVYRDPYHNFCYDDKNNYHYQILDVDMYYKDDPWHERPKHNLVGVKYVIKGTAFTKKLEATTIEEAKKEFEIWYMDVLKSSIADLKEEIKERENELEEFTEYRLGSEFSKAQI